VLSPRTEKDRVPLSTVTRRSLHSAAVARLSLAWEEPRTVNRQRTLPLRQRGLAVVQHQPTSIPPLAEGG